MYESRLSKQSIIEVILSKKEMRDFRESLIISSEEKAFDVTDHQVAIQVVDELRRKFLLIDNKEDLNNIKETMIVEVITLIHKNRLSNFLSTCPVCGYRQFDRGVIKCNGCNQKYKSPGYRT